MSTIHASWRMRITCLQWPQCLQSSQIHHSLRRNWSNSYENGHAMTSIARIAFISLTLFSYTHKHTQAHTLRIVTKNITNHLTFRKTSINGIELGWWRLIFFLLAMYCNSKRGWVCVCVCVWACVFWIDKVSSHCVHASNSIRSSPKNTKKRWSSRKYPVRVCAARRTRTREHKILLLFKIIATMKMIEGRKKTPEIVKRPKCRIKIFVPKH